jgi:hypothetical protein
MTTSNSIKVNPEYFPAFNQFILKVSMFYLVNPQQKGLPQQTRLRQPHQFISRAAATNQIAAAH